jgi:hypothetical protein
MHILRDATNVMKRQQKTVPLSVPARASIPNMHNALQHLPRDSAFVSRQPRRGSTVWRRQVGSTASLTPPILRPLSKSILPIPSALTQPRKFIGQGLQGNHSDIHELT